MDDATVDAFAGLSVGPEDAADTAGVADAGDTADAPVTLTSFCTFIEGQVVGGRRTIDITAARAFS
jgi:hypothetical protein